MPCARPRTATAILRSVDAGAWPTFCLSSPFQFLSYPNACASRSCRACVRFPRSCTRLRSNPSSTHSGITIPANRLPDTAARRVHPPHHGLKPVALPPQCLKHVIRIGFPPLHDPPPFSAYLLITRSGPVTRMTHQTVPRAIRRTGTDIYIFAPATCRHRPAGTDIYIFAPSFIRPRRTDPVTSRRYGYIYIRNGLRQAPFLRFSAVTDIYISVTLFPYPHAWKFRP